LLEVGGDANLRGVLTRVRRLEERGLTESLEVGYRLSPRDRAYQEVARR
jgi:hypothetical protein